MRDKGWRAPLPSTFETPSRHPGQPYRRSPLLVCPGAHLHHVSSQTSKSHLRACADSENNIALFLLLTERNRTAAAPFPARATRSPAEHAERSIVVGRRGGGGWDGVELTSCCSKPSPPAARGFSDASSPLRVAASHRDEAATASKLPCQLLNSRCRGGPFLRF